MTGHDIKRGASLYSYQEEFFLGTLDLEGCIRESVAAGALGVETIAEQMMRGYPHLSEDFYRTWDRWRDEYGFTPTAHDMFAELKLYKDRPRPDDELVAEFQRDVDHAKRIGAPVIRVLAALPPRILDRVAPYAAERGIRLLVEVHAPHVIGDDWFLENLEVAQKHGPEVVGFMPDLGIYVKRLPRIVWRRALHFGAHEDWVESVVERFDGGEDVAGLIAEADARDDLNFFDKRLAYVAARQVWDEPRKLLDYMDWIGHVHAKFYEMTDEGIEYSIPYDQVLPVLVEGGFRGYLSSEYEGHRHLQGWAEIDSIEQVRRHQRMMARLLGEEE